MHSCSRLLYKEYTSTRLSHHIYSWYTIYNCTPRPTCYSRKGHSRHTQFRAVGHPNNTSWWVAINNNQIMQPGLKFIQDVFRWNIKQASYFLNKNIQITIFKIFFHSMCYVHIFFCMLMHAFMLLQMTWELALIFNNVNTFIGYWSERLKIKSTTIRKFSKWCHGLMTMAWKVGQKFWQNPELTNDQ